MSSLTSTRSEEPMGTRTALGMASYWLMVRTRCCSEKNRRPSSFAFRASTSSKESKLSSASVEMGDQIPGRPRGTIQAKNTDSPIMTHRVRASPVSPLSVHPNDMRMTAIPANMRAKKTRNTCARVRRHVPCAGPTCSHDRRPRTYSSSSASTPPVESALVNRMSERNPNASASSMIRDDVASLYSVCGSMTTGHRATNRRSTPMKTKTSPHPARRMIRAMYRVVLTCTDTRG